MAPPPLNDASPSGGAAPQRSRSSDVGVAGTPTVSATARGRQAARSRPCARLLGVCVCVCGRARIEGAPLSSRLLSTRGECEHCRLCYMLKLVLAPLGRPSAPDTPRGIRGSPVCGRFRTRGVMFGTRVPAEGLRGLVAIVPAVAGDVEMGGAPDLSAAAAARLSSVRPRQRPAARWRCHAPALRTRARRFQHGNAWGQCGTGAPPGGRASTVLGQSTSHDLAVAARGDHLMMACRQRGVWLGGV